MIESDPTELGRAIEAIVLVAEESIESTLLAELLEVPVEDIDATCRSLAASYEDEKRGFALVPIAGGWRYQTHPDMAHYVERYVLDGQVSRLSAAALETLSIIAYKQPISRNQVAAIRGVSADGVMRTLESRGYITEFARDPGPGKAVLYGTTPAFLERLGLASLDELPTLVDFVPGTDVVEALETTLMVGSDDPAVETAHLSADTDAAASDSNRDAVDADSEE